MNQDEQSNYAPTFHVFTRTWWRLARQGEYGWPKGLVPCPGRKRYLARSVSYIEARELCAEYNATHLPGRFSRKAEFEQA